MAVRVLINDYPHRTVALATDTYALVFRYTQTTDVSREASTTSLPLANAKTPNTTARCMVEFAPVNTIDLQHYRNVATAKGTLGLITLNSDVFICVVTYAAEAATVRPGETVQKIHGVEFC